MKKSQDRVRFASNMLAVIVGEVGDELEASDRGKLELLLDYLEWCDVIFDNEWSDYESEREANLAHIIKLENDTKEFDEIARLKEENRKLIEKLEMVVKENEVLKSWGVKDLALYVETERENKVLKEKIKDLSSDIEIEEENNRLLAEVERLTNENKALREENEGCIERLDNIEKCLVD